jgi:ABC-2 type transport system ATP-binding protein
LSISVKHLTKTFGSQKAVHAISFQANKGEILGFLGPNGAGKTTTMRMITGYMAPDEGEILVDDIPVEIDNPASKSHIGYLPENNPLYPDMYVREYLLYASRLYSVHHADQRIDDVIGLTGLRKESHKKIGTLSKGYRQRVGLAQAILHDPTVLILDEATSGLDPNQLVEIRQLIRSLGKEKTILLSTHIMQEVQALCDRVVIIHQGKIVADGQIPMLTQLLSGQHKVKAKFSRTVLNPTFREIHGYVSHQEIAEHTYIIHGQDATINESVFDFALRKNLKILELVSIEESVEHIFQQLTAASS